MLKSLLMASMFAATLFSLAVPSAAWNATEGIIMESPVPGVTIVTVTEIETSAELPQPQSVIVSNQVIVIFRPHRLKRGAGWRYPGLKMYSGPQYPF